MNLSNKKVFISGGNGVIGNELVDLLSKKGAKLLVGDLKPRPIHWDKDIKYRQGDLNFITKEEVEDFQPEIFFHLAATFERSVETYEFWDENSWHNVRLSTYLMSLLKDCCSLKKVVFASSYLIYNPDLYLFDSPQNQAYNLKEDDTIYPRNLTGVAKLNHEIELRFLQEFLQERCSFVSARIYRSYGLNSKDIISRWVRDLLQDKELTVYCKEGKFDYIFARDVANGLIHIAEKDKSNGIYNIGNGNARSVEEVLQVLKNHFPNLKYKEIPSEIRFEASQADISKSKLELGWEPLYQIEKAIPEIIQFEKTRKIEIDSIPQKNVLFTSISKKIPMLRAAKNALNKLTDRNILFGADGNSECLGKYFVDKFWQMPKISDISITEIINFCNKNQISAIIPSRDGELLFWSKCKDILGKENIAVMISDEQSVNICLDKLLFFEHLKEKNLGVIETSDNIEKIITQKYVVKERFGAGSLSIGLNLNKTQAEEKAKQLEQPIFQPFIEGVEYSVDAYIDLKGNCKGLITRTRNLVVNGESQITITENNSTVETCVRKILNVLKLYGHVVFQIILDNKGVSHVIECNSRFGGASTLSIAAGLDSFYWFLLESNRVNLDEYLFFKSNIDKKLIRYANDLIVQA